MEHGQKQSDEDLLLRAVTLRNADSIQLARRRAEEALVHAKEALEHKTSELATSLAMMQATLESTTDGILATDGSGQVTGYNQNYLRMWRLPADTVETLQRDHRRLIQLCAQQFNEPARFIARVEEIYAASPPQSHDLLELADGRVFERASKIQYIDGHNAGRVWSFHDVTEQRRVEEALRDETRILELLNETGRTIGSTLDLQALVQSVTDAGTQLSGAKFGAFFYTSTDASGESLVLYTLSGAPREAFAQFGHPRATPLFGPTFRGAPAVRCDDVEKDPRYGQMEPHFGMPPRHPPVRSYLAVSVVSRSGEVIGGLFFGHPEPGVFTERTERLMLGLAAQAAVAVDNARLYDHVKRAAEERARLLDGERAARSEAERTSRMKDEFLASLSHELRTPLNAILGWSHVLRTDAVGIPGPAGATLTEGLETIERNARAQTGIIDDLLDMSRIISGKLRLDVQRVHLPSVVEAAVETVRPSADAKGVRLQVVLDPLAGPVSGDPSRLQQMVWNLLSNSIKFTPRGGRVQVLLERVNSHMELSIIDSGEGIAADFLPHVFDRFRQFDATSTRRHGGLGLGLSIVKQLAELHGGVVRAKSAGVGQGATFTLTLPVIPLHSQSSEELRRHPDAASGAADAAGQPATFPPDDCALLKGLRVLVVDDEPDSRHLVKRLLADCEAHVITAASAAEAFAILRADPAALDVLVSDIGMPEEDGYSLIRKIRALPPGAGGRIPAVALTAYARSEDRRQAILAGYQMHVAKPVEPAELITMITSVAGRTRLGP